MFWDKKKDFLQFLFIEANENNENQDVDDLCEQLIRKSNSLVFSWPYDKSFIDQAFNKSFIDQEFLWTLISSRSIKCKTINRSINQ